MEHFLRLVVLLLLTIIAQRPHAQQMRLGNNPYTVEKSAVLELQSANQGLLYPRISDTLLINSLTPPDGMVIFFVPAKKLLLRSNGSWEPVAHASEAVNYWQLGGNSGTSTGRFLGTREDAPLDLRSFNASYIEMGRRQTLGLTQTYTDYTNDNEQVIHLKGALQFQAAGADFYKPKIFVDANSNFRIKGSAAGTDFFEMGSTGTANNGGFEFIVGDDGTEPIVFSSNHYLSGTTETMRLQSGRMALGSTTFNATSPEKLLVDAGTTSSFNLINAKGSINNYLQLNIQNRSAGAVASSDIVATADNGDESTKYIDMGINSSGFTNTTYPMISGINNAYLYATGNDFVIGNATASMNLRLFTGGYALTNERMRIDGSGNVGIGTTAPSAKLDDNGTYRLGAAGSVNKNLIAFAAAYASGTVTAGAVAAVAYSSGSRDVTITIPAATRPTSLQATVSVSPDADLPAGISIAWARLISVSQVKVRLLNASTTAQTFAGTFFITITEF